MPENRRQFKNDSFILGRKQSIYEFRSKREMMSAKDKEDYYAALLAKNSEYEGLFYVGVKTTGVFCRPTCPARKPKLENCEFYSSAQEALLAGFRPCKRCRPLALPNQTSPLIQTLIDAVEAEPEKRWQEKDFQALGVDVSTVRRQFQKRFGMTFVAYARARRMGLALQKIRAGETIIDAQLTAGYESSSGFRDAFNRIMGAAPSLAGAEHKILKAAWLDTRLGPMVAIADEHNLYLLEFIDRRGLEREVERLRKKLKAIIIPGKTAPIISIEKELTEYFAGLCTEFKTPVCLLGSAFQQKVWLALKQIPLGTTRSYVELAILLGHPKAFRAVANANGANQLAIIIPCHRIINSNGDLGGYAGGLTRKQWLLEHEKRNLK